MGDSEGVEVSLEQLQIYYNINSMIPTMQSPLLHNQCNYNVHTTHNKYLNLIGPVPSGGAVHRNEMEDLGFLFL